MVFSPHEQRQFAREPLTDEQADRLSNACEGSKEKLIVWTLLDTGLRVSELCSLTPQHGNSGNSASRGRGGRTALGARSASCR